jgi:hypothetical protein
MKQNITSFKFLSLPFSSRKFKKFKDTELYYTLLRDWGINISQLGGQ